MPPSVVASVLYPTYASYKALGSPRTRVDSTSELERWTRYWCVMAFVWVYQDWVEWSLAWVPFYCELRTLLLLWIVLPQFKGSNRVYLDHVSPFLATHERSVDAFVSSLSTRVRAAGFDYLRRFLVAVRRALLGGGGRGGGAGDGDGDLAGWIAGSTGDGPTESSVTSFLAAAVSAGAGAADPRARKRGRKGRQARSTGTGTGTRPGTLRPSRREVDPGSSVDTSSSESDDDGDGDEDWTEGDEEVDENGERARSR
ncbi:hypothetical protein JCM11491_002830 [Sporobolomyces phaffii]